MSHNTNSTPHPNSWQAHGVNIWHPHNSGDRLIAVCSTEEHARLIAASPALLALAIDLLREHESTRGAFLDCSSVNGLPKSTDPNDRATLAKIDAMIARANTIIQSAKGTSK